MDSQRRVRISKFLSKHLRHQPRRLGLELDPSGWVPVERLLDACASHSFPISHEELAEVVATSDKQRFAFDPSGTMIRANQGHSIPIDLQLESRIPPDTLYHGTARRNEEAILQHGLKKMKRHHVHLSRDISTALAVGRRHGAPVVFAVDAAAMQRDDFSFYCSENGVWLVDEVPPQYLSNVPAASGGSNHE
jgi:putative RNA 2'-phosphotransferase